MLIVASRRVRLFFVTFLVFCFLPTAITLPWLGVLHDSKVKSEPILFISSISNDVGKDVTVHTRHSRTEGFSDLLKASFISEWLLFPFTGAFLLYSFQEQGCIISHVNRSVTPARAPPLSR